MVLPTQQEAANAPEPEAAETNSDDEWYLERLHTLQHRTFRNQDARLLMSKSEQVTCVHSCMHAGCSQHAYTCMCTHMYTDVACAHTCMRTDYMLPCDT